MVQLNRISKLNLKTRSDFVFTEHFICKADNYYGMNEIINKSFKYSICYFI